MSTFSALRRVLLLSALSLFASISLTSFAADSDGDGVDDLQDAYPNDSSKQYLPFAEALEKVEDASLRD